MSAENDEKENGEEKISLKKKFIATRYALERVLFDEEEKPKEKKPKFFVPVLGILAIVAAEALMLGLWFVFRDGAYSPADMAHISLIKKFSGITLPENWGALWNPHTLGIKCFAPPFYYLACAMVLKISGSLPFSVFLVNILCFAATAFSFYFLLAGKRGAHCAWVAAAFAGSMPFMLDAMRRPDPVIAAVALACASWAVFISSGAFEKGRFSGLLFGIFAGLGLLSHKFFFFWILPPLWVFVFSLLSFGRTRVVGGNAVLFLLAGPWYAKNGFYYLLIALFAGGPWKIFSGFSLENFLWPFSAAVESMQLVLFLAAVFFLAWMCYAVFNPYDEKKPVMVWLLFPCVIFAFLFEKNPSTLYPALVASAVAAGVMVPKIFAKHFLAFLAALFLINQSGLVPVIRIPFLGNAPLLGLPGAEKKADPAAAVVNVLRERFESRALAALIYDSRGPGYFSLRAEDKNAAPLDFSVFSEKMNGFYDAVVVEKELETDAGKQRAGAFFKSPWFKKIYDKLGDGRLEKAGAEIYLKKVRRVHAEEGTYKVKRASIGPLSLRDARIVLKDFDAQKGIFKKALISSVYASLGELDIYNLKLAVDDFSFVTENKNVLASMLPVEAGRARIRFARITDYSIAQYLRELSGFFNNIDVRFKKGRVALTDSYWKNARMHCEWLLSKKGGEINLKLKKFSFYEFWAPSFALKPFDFGISPDNPYFDVEFGSFKFHGAMVEISS